MVGACPKGIGTALTRVNWGKKTHSIGTHAGKSGRIRFTYESVAQRLTPLTQPMDAVERFSVGMIGVGAVGLAAALTILLFFN